MQTPTATPPSSAAPESLTGQRIAFIGRLAGLTRRDAQRLIRRHGATAAPRADETTTIVVIGEEHWPLGAVGESDDLLPEWVRSRAADGQIQVITETALWQRLGMVDGQQNVHRLYTPAMLAGMLGVSVSIVRRWQRRGLIVPVREVYNLPYFDFQEVAAARRLAELLAAGVTPAAIEKKLEALARFLPDVRRPLAQLSVIVEGKQILLRQGEGLIEPGGQLRFDFDAAEPCHKETAPPEVISIGALTSPQSPEQLLQLAETYEDQGHLDSAVVAYRSALIAGGPRAGVCFQLAELLYRLGDLSAARERYYMAVELDEDFVPARANLGCVLAETGELELAASAFSGALDCYPDYPDVHYHLARTLDELNRPQEAEIHWRAFLTLTPDSPWADEARERVKSFELRIEKR